MIELSLVADLARDAAIVADRVGAARRVRLASASADRSADLRPVAAAAAAQVGDVLRRLRDDGVTDYHVLLASPAPLAALIGRHLHALGTVHVYFSNRDRVISRAYSVRV